MADNHWRKQLLALLIILSALVVFGLLWAFVFGGAASSGLGWYLFSYAMGLTMIVLPCTLPLAFVIVPLAMGRGPAKGLGMALAFGLGITITLSFYGVLAAVVGQVAIGALNAPLEIVKNWVYFIAGIFAYLFALGEIGLVKYRMPTYTGAIPAFIQRRGDYLKALMLGLFLGNIGVGCPHPATPLILTEIASSGDIFYGWSLFFVHAVGRVLPLILLALLGILGVNALSWVLARKNRLERATGWLMVFVAGFILVLGLFTHDWWVNSGMHTLLEEVTQEERFLGILSQKFGGELPHRHGLEAGEGLFGLPLGLGNWVLVLLWLWPLWWYYKKQTKLISTMSDEDKKVAERVQPWRFWFSAMFSILIVLLFTYVLPNRFLQQLNADDGHDQIQMMGDQMMGGDQSEMMMPGHDDDDGLAFYHEEDEVAAGLAVSLSVKPPAPEPGEPAALIFTVEERPDRTPVAFDRLEIDHLKPMHVIGVRTDLENFFHIHPEPTADIGKLVTLYQFPTAGQYKLWSEIKVAGAAHTLGHPLVSVGEPAAALPEINLGRNVIVGDYQVAFLLDEPVSGGQTSQFAFEIHDLTGGEVALDDYLAAPMHLAIIKSDLSRLIHTHPLSVDGHQQGSNLVPWALAHGEADGEVESMLGQGPISFAAVFPEPGWYKLFAQFRPVAAGLPADEALLASFWLEVADTGTASSNVPEPLLQSESPSRMTLAVISLGLILVLSWGVSRFVNH